MAHVGAAVPAEMVDDGQIAWHVAKNGLMQLTQDFTIAICDLERLYVLAYLCDFRHQGGGVCGALAIALGRATP